MVLEQAKAAAFSSPSPIMGVACLAFFIVAAVRVFGARRELYVAMHTQDECGKDQALELETARYQMHKTFYMRNPEEAASIRTAFIACGVVMLIMCGLAIARRFTMSTMNGAMFIVTDLNFWIFMVMIGLMIAALFTSTNLVKPSTGTVADVKNVHDTYKILQDTMPSTLEPAFPKAFVDALVRRWYANNRDERRKPEEIRQVFANMVTNHDILTKVEKTAITAPFYEFLGYVHPPSDLMLANRSRGGLSMISSDNGQRVPESEKEVEDYKRAQIFLESLRPLVKGWAFDQSAAIEKQLRTMEWLLFLSIGILAIFYVLAPIQSDVAYQQIYSNTRL